MNLEIGEYYTGLGSARAGPGLESHPGTCFRLLNK